VAKFQLEHAQLYIKKNRTKKLPYDLGLVDLWPDDPDETQATWDSVTLDQLETLGLGIQAFVNVERKK
jgi:hypothetical protein